MSENQNQESLNDRLHQFNAQILQLHRERYREDQVKPRRRDIEIDTTRELSKLLQALVVEVEELKNRIQVLEASGGSGQKVKDIGGTRPSIPTDKLCTWSDLFSTGMGVNEVGTRGSGGKLDPASSSRPLVGSQRPQGSFLRPASRSRGLFSAGFGDDMRGPGRISALASSRPFVHPHLPGFTFPPQNFQQQAPPINGIESIPFQIPPTRQVQQHVKSNAITVGNPIAKSQGSGNMTPLLRRPSAQTAHKSRFFSSSPEKDFRDSGVLTKDEEEDGGTENKEEEDSN